MLAIRCRAARRGKRDFLVTARAIYGPRSRRAVTRVSACRLRGIPGTEAESRD